MAREVVDPDSDRPFADSASELEFEAEDDEVVEVPCQYCGKLIWEEAVSCEHCGSYRSQEDRPWRRPMWVIVGVVLCLACVITWLMRR